MTTTPAHAVAGALEAPIESHLHPTPSWDVADHPVPTGREEVWRFTPLRRLRGLHADAVFQPSTTACTWNQPEGVRVEPVSGEARARWRGISGYVPTDRASARILSELDSTLTVDVAPEAEVAEPITIDLVGSDAGTVEAGHIAVRVGHHAKATVLLRHEGSATLAHLVEFLVEDGAELTVVSLQDWADDTVHLVQHAAGIGRDARFKHVAATLGGDAVRLSTEVKYNGPGGEAELLGLYFTDAGQHQEHRLFVDHNAPHTKSDVDYRGALQGKDAHSVWIGDVLIRKVAEGIETYESNKNLVLTEGARADSVPNLEIETGEIAGAGHASTTGRFDDEQLFYLMSRGIDAAEARSLVVRGFFRDIIRKVGVESVEQRLDAAVEAELELAVEAVG